MKAFLAEGRHGERDGDFDQIHVPEFEEGITDPESRGLLE